MLQLLVSFSHQLLIRIFTDVASFVNFLCCILTDLWIQTYMYVCLYIQLQEFAPPIHNTFFPAKTLFCSKVLLHYIIYIHNVYTITFQSRWSRYLQTHMCLCVKDYLDRMICYREKKKLQHSVIDESPSDSVINFVSPVTSAEETGPRRRGKLVHPAGYSMTLRQKKAGKSKRNTLKW